MNIKKTFAAAAALLACIFLHAADNIAYQDANVRFTIISDGAVRMEYSPSGSFVDEKSFLAVERDYAPVKYTVSKGSWIKIKTPQMTVSYKKGSGEFTARNLSVKAFDFTWHPGDTQKHNLKGTYRTLDRYNGEFFDDKKDNPLPIEDGILARDGWTLIDDSANYLFDGDPDWEWVKERNAEEGRQDWYFLAYGQNYRQALLDYTKFAGKVPLPPRYAFGYWWSRYWSYSDHELRGFLDDLEAYGIPLDVLVIDMDWHYADKKRGAWTGWTWNKELFPDYKALLKHLREDRDVKVTLNLHPADGIRSYEPKYEAVAKDAGLDPSTGEKFIWTGSDKKFVQAMFRHILDLYTGAGVDFWWLDWQQFLTDPIVKGMSNTWWINYVFFSHMENTREVRPLLYHRWGGLGNHRYQVGFSGDTWITWESLDYQPWFNSTASNVLYGYWSHDIGGHMNADHIDPELYLRWMQLGTYLPIMRTHSTKNSGLNKEFWEFDKFYSKQLRRTVLDRYTLVPYIYTMARQTFDTGVSICRPLYYDYPADERAYTCRNEYMFGDNLLIAPITAPAKDGWSELEVFLPEGRWYEIASGTLLEGSQVLSRRFNLSEYPVYAKAGAIVPEIEGRVKNLRNGNEPLCISIYPGADEGSFALYEDAGDNKDYAGSFAITPISYTRAGARMTIRVGAAEGEYAGKPASRKMSIKLHGCLFPTDVKVNGMPAKCTYDGANLAAVVTLSDMPASETAEITLAFPESGYDLNAGAKGHMARIAEALIGVKFRGEAGIVLCDELAEMGSIIEAMTYRPEAVEAQVATFEQRFQDIDTILASQKFKSDDSREWLKNQL